MTPSINFHGPIASSASILFLISISLGFEQISSLMVFNQLGTGLVVVFKHS
ncbi:hypothetical protein Scep_030500 [Stephania cephalantha]|uniref:Uncharacterized protein n=1 Tax=Stephania cephalantha TaxID=152367 RepID=A0AAP0HEE4_9MAGN